MRKLMVDLLLLPPTSILILLLAGLFCGVRWPRVGKALVCAATLALWLCSTPIFASRLTRSLGEFEPVDLAHAQGAQAIVILAAEQRYSPEYGGVVVGDLGLERLRFGARLAKRSGLPVLLSGGRFMPSDKFSMAQLMQEVLQEDHGLSARWLETNSLTTQENASNSANQLKAVGITSVILVTHHVHMGRAAGYFRLRGISVIPAPVRVPAKQYQTFWQAVRPSLNAMADSRMALYELLALAEQGLFS